MAYKLDIFDVLGKLDSAKSGDVYANLSAEEKKGFAPLIIARWMSGTSSQQQITFINEFVNPYLFSLGQHPHLLALCLQAASDKKSKRYYWLGVKSKKHAGDKVIAEFYELSEREVKMMNPKPPAADIYKMAEQLGWDKEQLAKLKKELEL